MATEYTPTCYICDGYGILSSPLEHPLKSTEPIAYIVPLVEMFEKDRCVDLLLEQIKELEQIKKLDIQADVQITRLERGDKDIIKLTGKTAIAFNAWYAQELAAEGIEPPELDAATRKVTAALGFTNSSGQPTKALQGGITAQNTLLVAPDLIDESTAQRQPIEKPAQTLKQQREGKQ